MKTTHVRLKKTLTLAAAGKMALAAGNASAALGKADTDTTGPGQLPAVSLDQIGYPLDLITPPTVGVNSQDVEATLGKAGSSSDSFATNSSGFIWAGELRHASTDGKGDETTEPTTTIEARIDFIVNGIRNDIPMQIFLAYATSAGRSDAWIPSANGQLELDPDSLQVMAAIQTQPVETLVELPATPLGTIPARDSRSITIPLVLSDLSDPSLSGNNIYFQAIAIPVSTDGSFQWEQSQVSELDHYRIERYVEGTDSGSKNSAGSTPTKTGDDTGVDDTAGGK